MNAQERTAQIASRKEEKPPAIKLWCKEQHREFMVYRVPVDALLLNTDNRRFAAERKLMEEGLGHSLDPENSTQDEQSVISILLDRSLRVDGDTVVGSLSKDSVSLQADWELREQEAPLWIRPDGTVRNGNRRLAMVKRKRGQTGLEGTEWIDAVILEPSEIDEHDLFEMEQREQLTQGFKVRYTDINLLLALRDAANERAIDWADPEDIDRVAGEIQQNTGGNKRYAVVQLNAIKYMDAYLDDSNAQGQYQILMGQVEKFRDVGKNMVQMEADYRDYASGMLRLCFAAIRSKNPYGDIRSLRQMFIHDRPRYDVLLLDIEEAEQDWEVGEITVDDPDPTVITGEVDDDDETEDPPPPTTPNYPEKTVNVGIKNAIDGFRANDLDVASNLRQALNRLDLLVGDADKLSDALGGQEASTVRELTERIIAWSMEAEGILKRS